MEMFLVGPPRIELGLHEPESCVLPAYSGPTRNTSHVVRNNLLVATRKFSRPCLTVLSADKTWLRLAQTSKKQSNLLLACLCAPQDSDLRPFACEANALTN